MKYKILLTGKNNATMDDFFYAMFDEFECVTTSSRPRDIEMHIQLFQPDAIVCCLGKESAKSDNKQTDSLKSADRGNIPIIVIGDSERCAEFTRINPYVVDLILEKPLSAKSIQDEIVKFLIEKKEQEEAARMQQIMLQEKAALQQEEVQESISRHILVIDDDPLMLRVIKEELKEEFNVATAVSGKIGLSFLQRKKTDLILLDYEMPEENGLEVLEKLRANDSTKDIPVIFLTGINDREKISKVLAKKPQGYLLKPIDHTKLIEEIQKVLG